MKRFQIKNIRDIPFEGTHDLPNSRQTLVTSEDVLTSHLDAMTKGTLESGKIWDWHSHDKYDELGIVIQGEGAICLEGDVSTYKKDDEIIIPAGVKHKFEATGDSQSEFYFVRIEI